MVEQGISINQIRGVTLPFMDWIKQIVIGSPFEGLARKLYIRLDPSVWSKSDRLTLRVLDRCLTADSNCIDVGAFRGSILQEIVARAPRGTHFAFEPLAEEAAYLVEKFPAVKVFPIALSNQSGKVPFSHNLKHPTRSSFNIPHPADPREIIQIDTEKLDNLIPADLKIRLIKIDVEGAEYQVFQGSLKTIRASKPVIIFEHTEVAWRRYSTTTEQVYKLLTHDCGLQVSSMENWLEGSKSFSCEEFVQQVKTRQNFYFIAYA
jgi:FkbM family methyltransferase